MSASGYAPGREAVASRGRILHDEPGLPPPGFFALHPANVVRALRGLLGGLEQSPTVRPDAEARVALDMEAVNQRDPASSSSSI